MSARKMAPRAAAVEAVERSNTYGFDQGGALRICRAVAAWAQEKRTKAIVRYLRNVGYVQLAKDVEEAFR